MTQKTYSFFPVTTADLIKEITSPLPLFRKQGYLLVTIIR